MSLPSYTVVANWKMYLLPEQTVAFIEHNYKPLAELATTNHTIVLCPSFEALFMVKHAANDLPLAIGAQDCSAYAHGAYTGQVAAASLKQLGCGYCIIGHSETRKLSHQSDTLIAEKMAQLFAHDITPIICVGETKQEREHGTTAQVLQRQLAPIVAELTARKDAKKLHIAYEPLWAIGSGTVAHAEQITDAFATITDCMQTAMRQHAINLLYGGSVTGDNVKALTSVHNLGGFLVGSASTDFQAFKKIVDCL